MNVDVRVEPLESVSAELLAVLVPLPPAPLEGPPAALDGALGGALQELRSAGDLAKAEETALLYPRGALPARRVLAVGLNVGGADPAEALRRAAAAERFPGETHPVGIGGGDAGCPTRDCPSERGYAGCWECAEFPCDRGPFGRPDFGGTTIAYVRAAQRIGVPAMLERARAALGDQIDYVVVGIGINVNVPAAFWAGEFANSFVLAKLKVLTAGRFLWMRTIGSTVVGQGLDSLIFYPLAFYGLAGWPVEQLWQVVLSQWLIKTAWEALLTPVTYMVVNFLKRREGVEVFDTDTDFSPFALSR